MHNKQNISVTYQSIVGEVIAQNRKRLNLNQGEFADRVGLSQSAWSRIEKGLTNITTEQLAKASKVLNTKPHEILMQADDSRDYLEENGVTVLDSKPADNTGWLLLGAAALAALVLASSRN